MSKLRRRYLLDVGYEEGETEAETLQCLSAALLNMSADFILKPESELAALCEKVTECEDQCKMRDHDFEVQRETIATLRAEADRLETELGQRCHELDDTEKALERAETLRPLYREMLEALTLLGPSSFGGLIERAKETLKGGA